MLIKKGVAASLGIAIGKAHIVKEENILYPAADQTAGGERERDDLVKRIQAS